MTFESYIRQRVTLAQYDVPLVNPFVVPTPDDTFTDMIILTDKRIELHLCYAPGHTDDLVFTNPNMRLYGPLIC